MKGRGEEEGCRGGGRRGRRGMKGRGWGEEG